MSRHNPVSAPTEISATMEAISKGHCICFSHPEPGMNQSTSEYTSHCLIGELPQAASWPGLGTTKGCSLPQSHNEGLHKSLHASGEVFCSDVDNNMYDMHIPKCLLQHNIAVVSVYTAIYIYILRYTHIYCDIHIYTAIYTYILRRTHIYCDVYVYIAAYMCVLRRMCIHCAPH